jgi:hypothetical protein
LEQLGLENKLNMEELNKSTKVVVLGLVGSVVAFFAIFAFWTMLAGPSGGDFFLKQAYSLEFKGKVDSIYRDENNHNTKMAILSSGFVYALNGDWEEQVTKGDILEKKRSSFYVVVHKASGEHIILDYRKLTQVINNK